MPTITPAQLVEEFKKSGEFERLRRELLVEFEHGNNIDSFKSRIESIAKQRLSKDPEKFRDADANTIRRDLKKEVDRYPIIERAIGEIPSVRNESVARTVESSAQRVLGDLRVKLEAEEKEAAHYTTERRPRPAPLPEVVKSDDLEPTTIQNQAVEDDKSKENVEPQTNGDSALLKQSPNPPPSEPPEDSEEAAPPAAINHAQDKETTIEGS